MHSAHSWRDYFKVNTDHKVIGVQYLVTVFFFFVVFEQIFANSCANWRSRVSRSGETYNGAACTRR